MSTEEKAKAYDEALSRAKALYDNESSSADTLIACEAIFSEFAESEDERIRKSLIDMLKNDEKCYLKEIAWLEKQVSEPNWCHHKVDLSGYSEEYRKAYYDGWNNCNMQHSQCKIELDDVVKCLINGMKFYYEDNEDATWGTEKWSMPVKHIIDVLEKQVPVDEDEIVERVIRGIAISLKNYIDANSKGMCLPNMECEDIENAVANEDWDKVYRYMKKKLEKQGEKGSEDGRIKEVLIYYFNKYKEQEECGINTFYGIPTDNILAWLEKQGKKGGEKDD